MAPGRGITFEGLTQEQLVEQRRPYVERTRESYRAFCKDHVQRSEEDEAPPVSSGE